MGYYRDLTVWQKAMDLVVLIYELTRLFPKEETYALISQMRRAAISIPSNIAEGQRRKSQKDFCHFLDIAYGSGAELETHIEIAKRLGYAQNNFYQGVEDILIEVMKMLNTLISTLRTTN